MSLAELDRNMSSAVLHFLAADGWLPAAIRTGDWQRMRHRCGSVASVNYPLAVSFNEEAALRAVKDAVSSVVCYCVPPPPEGWVPPDPDDALPATRGQVKELQKAVDRLVSLQDRGGRR